MPVAEQADVLLVLQSQPEACFFTMAEHRLKHAEGTCLTSVVPNISSFTWPPPNSFFTVARVAA